MVKMNENQSIRTHKYNLIFCGKGHLRLLLTPWNMKNVTFGPKWAKLCKRLRKVRKLKLFSREWSYRTNFYLSMLWDRLSQVNETGCFHFLPNYIQEVYINTYSKRNQPLNENKEKLIFNWLSEPMFFKSRFKTSLSTILTFP